MSLIDSVHDAVEVGAVAGSLIGIAYSAVVTSAASMDTPRRGVGQASSGGDDNLVWGLIGFISCLPLFNWLVRRGALAGGGAGQPGLQGGSGVEGSSPPCPADLGFRV